jgi:multidrug efflux pump subunit AcrA (membrane-fusion protein)
MSAILNPVPPVQPSAPPAPPPAAKKTKRPAWIAWVIAAVVAAAGVAAWQYFARQAEQKQAAAAVPVRTAKVAQGDLDLTLRVAGNVAARQYVNVTTPFMSGPESERPLLLMKLISTGTMVKAGQEVALIDAQALQDHVDDVHSTVLQSEADIRKRAAERQIETENLNQTVRVAKAELDKLRVDSRALEVRTSIDQELIKLSVEESDARYKQLAEEVNLKKVSHGSEAKILDYTRLSHTRHRDRHKRDLVRFRVISPMDGMAVLQTVWRNGEFVAIGEGDQTFTGQLLMKVVNPNDMHIEAMVNQANVSQIRIGQPAKVQLDAFPGLELTAKVDAIGAIAIGGFRQNAYIRNVPVRVRIEGSNPKVIPDLSASADILLSRTKDAVIVPLGAVQQEGDSHFVYVRSGNGFERRDVRLGVQNNTHAAVLAGVSVGDEVALNYEPPTVK